ALSLQTSIYLNPALRHLTRQGSQTQHSTRPTGDRAVRCNVRLRTFGGLRCQSLPGHLPAEIMGSRSTGAIWSWGLRRARREWAGSDLTSRREAGIVG